MRFNEYGDIHSYVHVLKSRDPLDLEKCKYLLKKTSFSAQVSVYLLDIV